VFITHAPNLHVCCFPIMQGRMRNAPGYFVGPFQPGKPLDGMGIAVVT
jgi:NADPH-dependent curcumin reductase CurA